MRKIVLASALLCSTSAIAADLPSVKSSPVAPAPIWTGLYGGLNVGYGFGTNEYVLNSGSPGGFFVTTAGAPIANALLSTNNTGGVISSSGVIAGGQVGYNRQVTPQFVFGVEADIQGSGLNGSGTLSGVGIRQLTSTSTFGYALSTRVTESLSYIGTARGRVGYLVAPTVMIYGTAGLAYGEKNLTASPSRATFQETTTASLAATYPTLWSQGSASNFAAGWTAGGGAEWMVAPNWSVKGEALYYDLGGLSASNEEYRVDVTTPYAASVLNTQVKFEGIIARAGVNYHFNLFGK
jgi:outer membrane immunogenic protein